MARYAGGGPASRPAAGGTGVQTPPGAPVRLPLADCTITAVVRSLSASFLFSSPMSKIFERSLSIYYRTAAICGVIRLKPPDLRRIQIAPARVQQRVQIADLAHLSQHAGCLVRGCAVYCPYGDRASIRRPRLP